METLFIGKNIIFLPETDSTNSYATELLKNVNLPEGSVIHTTYQRKGKGQRGNTWVAEALSNLTISVILKPTFLDAGKQFFLYQVAALACYDALSELLNNGQFDIKIKWPNDILVNGRKVAGILIENNYTNEKLNWCVVGIGVNVNQVNFKGLTNATSLQKLSSKTFAVEDVLKLVCIQLEKYYLALKAGKYAGIKQKYLESLHGFKKQLWFEHQAKTKLLMVEGISDKGLLMLEDEKGVKLEVDLKEIKWLN